MNKHWHKIYLGAMAIGIALFFISECNHIRDSNKLVSDIANYNDTAEFYKLKNWAIVAFNQSLVLQNETQMKALFAQNDTMKALFKKFSSIQSTTIVDSRTFISNDTIRLSDTIPCDFAPIRVRRDSIHYVFDGRITNKSLIIDSIVIPNEQTIIIGTKKIGLFRRERQVNILNSNPLVRPVRIKNYVIDDHKKWYQKTGTKIVFGMVLGGAGVYYLRK